MLKLAYQFKDELQKIWYDVMESPKFKFYNLGTWCYYELDIKNDNWDNIQFVSMDKHDNILGFFKAKFDRDNLKYYDVAVFLFHNGNSVKRDMYRFFRKMYDDKRSRKIEWSVVVGNKDAEKMYDKIVAKYTGCVAGVRFKTVRLSDGYFYDQRYYEVFTNINKHEIN